MKFPVLILMMMISMNVVAYNDSINPQNIIEIVSPQTEKESISEVQKQIIKKQIQKSLPNISEKRLEKIQKRVEKRIEKKMKTADEGGAGGSESVAGFVLGLLSLVFFWIPFIGLALGIVGLVLSINDKKKSSKKGLAQAGFIMSIIGTAIGALFALFFFVGLLVSLFAAF